jgi:hypothetical protein
VWSCFFVIEHERRRILHFNVTRHPSADWVVQQLRETFAEAAPYRYAILDHDCDQAPLRGQQPKASGSAGGSLLSTHSHVQGLIVPARPWAITAQKRAFWKLYRA